MTGIHDTGGIRTVIPHSRIKTCRPRGHPPATGHHKKTGTLISRVHSTKQPYIGYTVLRRFVQWIPAAILPGFPDCRNSPGQGLTPPARFCIVSRTIAPRQSGGMADTPDLKSGAGLNRREGSIPSSGTNVASPERPGSGRNAQDRISCFSRCARYSPYVDLLSDAARRSS
jgi:hypothetical protein